MAVKERSLAAFESTGLNPQHHAVLSLLDEGERETQATIADALGYDRGHLVGLLDELERKSFVERRRDPGDRRRHLVSLTPTGADALLELRSIAKGVEKKDSSPRSMRTSAARCMRFSSSSRATTIRGAPGLASSRSSAPRSLSRRRDLEYVNLGSTGLRVSRSAWG